MPKPTDAPPFPGFRSPHYTQVPDDAFDELMPLLSGSEWKVLCYIMRHTFGWKKESDNLSIKQFCSGIRARDGRVIDGGTGLSKSAVITAIQALEEWGIVIRHENTDPELGDLPSTFSLRMAPQGGGPKSARGSSNNHTGQAKKTTPGPVQNLHPQETDDPKDHQENGVTLDEAKYTAIFGAARTGRQA